MSSGNITTEHTRRELALDEAAILEAGLVRNSVLRRALAIAACEHADLLAERRGYAREPLPDAGMVLMLCAVMQASDEVEKERAAYGQQDGD